MKLPFTVNFLIGALVLQISPLSAQSSDADKQFIKDSLELVKVKLVRPQFKFDNRVTFYEGHALDITGFEAGVLLVDKLRLTVGYYGLRDRLKAFDKTVEDQKFGRTYRLDYGSLNTELIYKDYRFFSWGMPLEIAAGKNVFQDKNLGTGEIISTQSGLVLFVNFGLSATYKPMRFLGLKGIIGYRKMAYNQVKDFLFDGFFTSIGLNVDVRSLVTSIKMYKLKKRYHRGNNIRNAVETITE
jgi:hypothetical protein